MYPSDYRSDIDSDCDSDNSDSSEEENEDEEEEDEEEKELRDRQGEEEILNLYRTQQQQPVATKKRPSTPPLFPANQATEYMNKMTLDLMMNPHYLSKANPEAFQRKIEEAQRIVKHKREIYKTMEKCFDEFTHLASGYAGDIEVDLDVQTGFLHFAKSVLLNTQQQNRVGKSDTEPIFSVCNDSHSSFLDEGR